MLVFGWPDWEVCLFMVALFAVPVWLFVLLPLYVLLPRSSSLWRTPICTALGAICGAAIVAAYLVIGGGVIALSMLWFFWVIGALVGAVTCFFGAITADYFHATQLA